VHDTLCVIYQAPDAGYRGREIWFSSAADASGGCPNVINTVSIVDLTEESNPMPIAPAEYDIDGYSDGSRGIR
jgi:hypothetical protein